MNEELLEIEQGWIDVLCRRATTKYTFDFGWMTDARWNDFSKDFREIAAVNGLTKALGWADRWIELELETWRLLGFIE